MHCTKGLFLKTFNSQVSIEKTREERNEIFLSLFSSPILHSDFTFGRMNGKQTVVIICVADDRVLYQGHVRKSNEGVKGSSLEFYEGTIISDHEATLIKHGTGNQECMTHVKRYVISCIQNKKPYLEHPYEVMDRRDFYVLEGVHAGTPEDPVRVKEFDRRYDEINFHTIPHILYLTTRH